MSVESAADRERRLAQRVLFDSVAELYQASRWGYADEVVDWVLAIRPSRVTPGLAASS